MTIEDKGRRLFGVNAVSGGEGAISVLEQRDADHYADVERIPTVKGARTGFSLLTLISYFWRYAARDRKRLRFRFLFRPRSRNAHEPQTVPIKLPWTIRL